MRVRICMFVLAALSFSTAAPSQERLPSQVAGTWRISRVLSVRSGACWTADQAQALLGTYLHYGRSQMRWQGGEVPLIGVTTRSVSAAEFAKENGSGDTEGLKFADLGIRGGGVTEVNLQHDDADITGSTTEVPGDSVLLAGRERIIVSACGVYMEARRVPVRPSTLVAKAP